MLNAQQGRILLQLARGAIAARFGLPATTPTSADWLQAPGATFVTLTQNGQLRGCIGTLEACRPLIDDVRHNALAAAFSDPRFPPLARDEFDSTRIEVSLLAPAEELTFRDEADAVRQLRPGVDGVILQHGERRSTFLPQVWEQLPDRAQFFFHLKHKAGLPTDYWSDRIRLFRYSVQKWHDE